MAKNNHFITKNKKKLDELLRVDESISERSLLSKALDYARTVSFIENAVVVVSDMADNRSYIMAGKFASKLGLEDYNQENSIWESRILSLMSPEEQEAKFITELRFFHYLRHLPCSQRPDFYLVSKLRVRHHDGKVCDLLHRMHYLFDSENETVRVAVCVYAPLTFDFRGRSHAVNSLTGQSAELTSSADNTILSRRELQVLSLIDRGMKSSEISDALNISVHTVNRHRQAIINKLQVRNSTEACRLAKSMGII